MSTINHRIRIILHLRAGHFNWVEDMSVVGLIKKEKAVVQQALKPGQVPGGSDEENIGVAYGYPDAKVKTSLDLLSYLHEFWPCFLLIIFRLIRSYSKFNSFVLELVIDQQNHSIIES